MKVAIHVSWYLRVQMSVRWVISGGVIYITICKELKNKIQRSNQRTHRDLPENSKEKNHGRESSTII